MSVPRVALGIRAQLLLVLTVFLAIPWLGYEYVRELERFLRDAQERDAGRHRAGGGDGAARPAAAVRRAAPQSLIDERSRATARPGRRRAWRRALPRGRVARDRADHAGPVAHDRAHLGDRPRARRARARGLAEAPATPSDAPTRAARVSCERVMHPLYALVLEQPTEDFSDERPATIAPPRRDVDGALAGILDHRPRGRRPTPRVRSCRRRASDLGRRPGARRGDRRGDGQRACWPSATARSSACSTSCSRRCWSARWR